MHRLTLLRALRVLLACSVLWLVSAAPAGAGAQPALPIAAFVAHAVARTAAPVLASARVHARAARPRSSEPAPEPSLTPSREPAGTTRLVVLVEDRYLRNCTLLS